MNLTGYQPDPLTCGDPVRLPPSSSVFFSSDPPFTFTKGQDPFAKLVNAVRQSLLPSTIVTSSSATASPMVHPTSFSGEEGGLQQVFSTVFPFLREAVPHQKREPLTSAFRTCIAVGVIDFGVKWTSNQFGLHQSF